MATDIEIAAAARAAGFPDIALAVAVALAESSGNEKATNTNSNGSKDLGLWQINTIHKAIIASGNPFDPTANARMAKQVYDGVGGKWTPWVAYKTGKHLVYMPRGMAAAKGVGSAVPAPDSTQTGTATDSGSADLSGFNKFASFVGDPSTWKRAGWILVGFFLLLIALWNAMPAGVKNVASYAVPITKVAKVVKAVK